MMIDTGAARNLIKQKVLNPEVPINRENVLKLTGINDLPLYTLGKVKINIFGYPKIFNIIRMNVINKLKNYIILNNQITKIYQVKY